MNEDCYAYETLTIWMRNQISLKYLNGRFLSLSSHHGLQFIIFF